MRVVFINQFGWPDSAPTSQLLCDVSRFLVKEGHEVDIVCGAATYVRDGDTDPPPVRIHRVPCYRFGRGARRIVSYATFMLCAAWKVLRLPKPDVVVTMTTPPLLSLLGTFLKIVRRDKHFSWEMDLFPEALVDTGMASAGSSLLRLLHRLARYSRRNSEGIIVLGECMKQRVVDSGVPTKQVHVAENWADSRIIDCAPFRRSDALTVLYSGNLGLTHDIDTITGAMARLSNARQLSFRFVGDGKGYNQVREFVSQHAVQNVSFQGYCPRAALSENLASADVGLVTQLASCMGTVVPSKIYGLMAAGRPILFVGPRESTVARVIEQYRCGWQIDNGDTAGLISLLQWLQENRGSVEACGGRGRRAFLDHYDLAVGVTRVARILGFEVAEPAVRGRAAQVS